MFTPEERRRVRDVLLERAEADEKIVGAALTGSGSRGAEDRWSDIDLYFGVADGTAREDVLEEWSSFVYRELGALHHFELDAGHALYRAFLLPDRLEIDLAFAAADRFGAHGPLFRPLFGTVVESSDGRKQASRADHLIGLGWHHALHADIALARGRPWQAEHWISALRDHVLALACLRLELPSAYAKGADALPRSITAPLEATLVASLEPQHLARALGAGVTAFLQEVGASSPELAARLRPALQSLADDPAPAG